MNTNDPRRPRYRGQERHDRHRSWLRPALLFSALAWVTACGISGPKYEAAPDTPVKASWSENPSTQAPAETIRLDWWRNFGDPYLDELIAQALDKNQDLLLLALRTGVSEATIKQAKAARLPTIDASISGQNTTIDNRRTTDDFGNPIDPNAPKNLNLTRTSYSAGISWELDIWGKLKKGVKAQEAATRASEAEWRAGYLTLASDVASTYFQIRQFDEQISQQEWSLKANDDILSIFQSQEREGMVPETQVMQQEAEVGRLGTDLLELQRLRQLATNALATLLGIPAGELKVPKQHLSDTIEIFDVPAGLPSDLLNRRPDIVAAQYRILQAYQLEGQASLARLPAINLTTNFGSSSADLGDLLSAWTAGVGSILSFPIFNPGVNAQHRVSQAESKRTEQEYRVTVMGAYEEVENALVNLFNRRRQHELLLTSRDKLDIVSIQVKARLQEGMVTQLEVFESERSLLTASQRLLANHQLVLSDTVALYKALGGGWPAETIGSAQPASQTPGG